MTSRQIGLVAMLGAWLMFFVLALQEAAYLQAGYSIGVALNAEPPSYSAVHFPWWRKVGQVILALGVAGAIVLDLLRAKLAHALAWTMFCALVI